MSQEAKTEKPGVKPEEAKTEKPEVKPEEAKTEKPEDRIKLMYKGKNPSYTVAGIRFTSKHPTAEVEPETARRLLTTGLFVEAKK
jgi:hypothetical protein